MEQEIYTKDAKTASSSSQPARGWLRDTWFSFPTKITGLLPAWCPNLSPRFYGFLLGRSFRQSINPWVPIFQSALQWMTCFQVVKRYLSAAGKQSLYNVDPIKVQNCESSRTALFLFAKSKKGTTKTYYRYYIIIVYHIIWHHVIIELYVLYVLYT